MSVESNGGCSEWTWPDGAVLVHTQYGRSGLVKVQHSSVVDRYGLHYIQFPELGRPSGGSGWCYGPEVLHEAHTPEQHLWVQQYRTAKRVLDLREALAEAEQDAEAVRRYAALTVNSASLSERPQ